MAILDTLRRMATGKRKELPAPAEQDGNFVTQMLELTPAQEKYGPNFEKLKELNPRIANALLQLTYEYRLEGIYSQRHKIQRIRYARYFWQGIQYCYWNSSRGDFDFASSSGGIQSSWGDPQEEQTGPRYEYVTNFYQAYGLSFIALISSDIPSWNPYPKSREVQEDITAAKVALDVGDLIERNNDPEKCLETMGRLLWTDGIVGQYWRYVVDGERFGYKTMPVLGAQQVDLDGQSLSLAVPQGTEKIPQGQEVVTYVGGLELVLPNYADDFHDCAYLQWNTEPHRARLKAAYPHAAQGIDSNSGLTADQAYERLSRLSIKQNIPIMVPGDALDVLPTFSRTWLRKWAFQRFEDKALVQELEELFPDGCYVAFAGLEFCEARSENIDKHWKVLHALPGDGQSRPAVGESLIDIQERYNTLSNIQTETYEYGIPPIYVDPGPLDFDALKDQISEPASMFPMRAKPGMALADSFFNPDPAKEPATLSATMQELMGPTAQFLTGLFPAIFGGEMSDVKTASGYAMARDQAMGRIGLIWRKVKKFYADGIGMGLEIFKENRPEDVEVPFPGENDAEKAKWIRLADFQGNVMVESEPDEAMPRLKTQQRGVLTNLLELAATSPVLMKFLDAPANLGWIKNVLGLNELVVPGEDSTTKQMREIQQLLESGPVVFPPSPTPQTNPQTGQTVLVMVPAPPQPTIGVNDLFDDHEVELQECIDWANSDQGQTAFKENPQGFQNVYLHAKMHQQILMQRQAAAQPKIPPKPPSMSVAVDKLPPEAQAQALAMDGISVNPLSLQAHQDQQREDKAQELQARLAGKNQVSA